MKRYIRPFARISWRLMAFNLLLVFLPVAGVLYLDTYEEHLVAAQERSLLQQADLIAAALAGGSRLSIDAAQGLVARAESTALGRPPEPYQPRIRVTDSQGRVIADSYWLRPSDAVARARSGGIQKSRLYRLGAFLMRPIVRLVRPPEPRLEHDDQYETANRLMGPEVRAALRGSEAGTKRISSRASALTLYRAKPIWSSRGVGGVVLVSQSTYPIIRDLYAVRLGILQIFVASLVAAIVISLLVATTIVRPLRQLRLDAHDLLDRRGRVRGRFAGSDKPDEIGDLARALERLTRRLDEHVRFIESFAADVSHEFKNPLASIRTASEMLAVVTEPSDRARFIGIIQRDVARMERLLSGVRDVTLVDAQLAREEREQVAVGNLLTSVVESFRRTHERRVQFELHDLATNATTEASADRLTQVFTNLLDNAVSFAPDGSVVTIHLLDTTEEIRVIVRDSGPGIPEAHLTRIFDRFFSYRPDAAKRDSHTGLGLAIVKTIVEGYGGQISARNNTPAPGATFEVTLPK